MHKVREELLVPVQTGRSSAKIYVAAMEALRKKRCETQFITKIDGFL
jgi:hypothetical protein